MPLEIIPTTALCYVNYSLSLNIPLIRFHTSLPNKVIEAKKNASPEIIKKAVAPANRPLDISKNGSRAITPQTANDKTKKT
jgi:hypothetical protein